MADAKAIEQATIALMESTDGSYFLWPDGTPRDPDNQHLWRDAMRAALREFEAAGYAIVPVEPTPSIIGAVAAAAREPAATMGDVSQRARAIWRDGLAAAQAKEDEFPA